MAGGSLAERADGHQHGTIRPDSGAVSSAVDADPV